MNPTALHEAAHAVACLELGRPFAKVSIEPRQESAGRVEASQPISLDAWLRRASTAQKRDEIAILLAGQVARRACGLGWNADHPDLRAALRIADDMPDPDRALLSCYAWSEALLNRRASDVLRLARALEARGTLTAAEVRRILTEAEDD